MYKVQKECTPKEDWGTKMKKELKLYVHDQESPPDIRNPINLVGGNEYIIKVKAVKIETEPAVEAISPEVRHCLYAHENHLALFEKYSKTACELECAVPRILEVWMDFSLSCGLI